MCYGQETIAKGCVRIRLGDPNPHFGFIGEVDASCKKRCNTNDMLPHDPFFLAMMKWFENVAINSCKQIDVNCGL